MEEQIISFAPQFNLDKVTRTIGDFVFTNERILFVNTLKGADILSFLWSSAPFSRRKKNSKSLQSMHLNEILQSNSPVKSIKYDELSSINIKIQIFKSAKITLNYKNGKQLKYWGRKKNSKDLIDKLEALKQTGVTIKIN